jgi:hypothetical protein
MGDKDLSDQAIHMAAGMLVAAYGGANWHIDHGSRCASCGKAREQAEGSKREYRECCASTAEVFLKATRRSSNGFRSSMSGQYGVVCV